MWVVFKNWVGYEIYFQTFDTEEEANKYFEEEKEYTRAQLYLARVDKVFNQKADS